MAGIVFVRTPDLDRIVAFYREIVGMDDWISQPDIQILCHGNMLVGFQRADRADVDILLTFFYPGRECVDTMHRKISGRMGTEATAGVTKPAANERYRIYNFFARDPDGRRIEFQTFDHPLPRVEPVEWA
jgi:catechol 2,3-dioxygenase-like lactoylglutathione lyase family enzyme